MPDETPKAFRLNDWLVEPDLDRFQKGDHEEVVEPKTMAVLVYLAREPGRVVSADEIIDVVWEGRPMGDNPVHKCIFKLRNALGDDARHPRYIATVPKKGYRLIAEVVPVEADLSARISPAPQTPTRDWSAFRNLRWPAAVLALVVVTATLDKGRNYFSGEAAPPPESIAVLPFANLSDNVDDAYFSDGVSEDIRAILAAIPGLHVSSRTSSRLFSGSGADLREIAEKLGVARVLEGTVRRQGDEVKITAQLISAATDSHDGSWSYTRKMQDIFGIQDEIARSVVERLLTHFPEIAPRHGTDSITAYDEYLRGIGENSRSPEVDVFERAETHFRQALEADPEYARAWAGLCENYRRRFVYSHAKGYFEQAEKACSRAAALDPALADVPLALGHLYREQGRWEEAGAMFEQAIALDVNLLGAYTGLASVLAAQGDLEAAEGQFQRALQAQPRNAIAYDEYAADLFRRGRFDDAARNFQRAIDLGTGNAPRHNNLGAAYYLLGDFEMAARSYARSIEEKPGRSAWSNLGTMQFYLGRYAEAAESYRVAIDFEPQDARMWGNLGDALGQLPEYRAQAADAYRRALELTEQELAVNENDAASHARGAAYAARLGQTVRANAGIERATKIGTANTYAQYHLAVAFMVLDRPDAALEMLEQMRAGGYSGRLIEVDPVFVGLRSRAEFAALIQDSSG